MANFPTTTRPRGRLSESSSVGSLCGEGGRAKKTCYGGGPSRGQAVQDSGVDGSISSRLLSSTKSSTGVRFSPGNEQVGFTDRGECDEEPRTALVAKVGPDSTQRSSRGCDVKVAAGMRRGSEMASWATCGAREKSAKDYLW